MAAIRGLYAVTPDCTDTASLLHKVEAAIAGGARLVQYRNKSATEALRCEQALALANLCRRRGVLFIVNDSVELATQAGADGVHLGAGDGSVPEARRRLGDGKIVGASCYGALSNALEAQRAGASYVAFGSFFASSVKPGAARAPVALLTEAKRAIGIPVVAIGGITPENAQQLIAAGADAVAVISALFDTADVEAAARRFSQLFHEQTQ